MVKQSLTLRKGSLDLAAQRKVVLLDAQGLSHRDIAAKVQNLEERLSHN